MLTFWNLLKLIPQILLNKKLHNTYVLYYITLKFIWNCIYKSVSVYLFSSRSSANASDIAIQCCHASSWAAFSLFRRLALSNTNLSELFSSFWCLGSTSQRCSTCLLTLCIYTLPEFLSNLAWLYTSILLAHSYVSALPSMISREEEVIRSSNSSILFLSLVFVSIRQLARLKKPNKTGWSDSIQYVHTCVRT